MYCISEIAKKNPFVILGVQPINTIVIENILLQFGIVNYCKPYDIVV